MLNRSISLFCVISFLCSPFLRADDTTPLAGIEDGVAAAAGKVLPTKAVIETSEGTIELELYPDKAPITVANFAAYAKSGFYEDTIFHRVMAGFMIQGGGLTADLNKKPTGTPIKNESGNGLKNTVGTVAMARLPSPDSATAQFFINVNDNPFLDYAPGKAGYAVFAKVTKGLDVVRKIEKVETGVSNGRGDVPKKLIVITSVTVE